MMDKPAFPVPFPSHEGDHGLTRRELFAAMALQGMLADGSGWLCTTDESPRIAVDYADALIAELDGEAG